MSDSSKFNQILEILILEKKFELHDFIVEMMELLDPDYNTESSESDEEITDGLNESIEVNVDDDGFYSIH